MARMSLLQILIKQSLTSDLNAHGLGEPLDDGEEGVGGEHGRLVRLRVDELAHVEVRRGSLDMRQPSVELQPVVGRVSVTAYTTTAAGSANRCQKSVVIKPQ